jgi:phosphatidylserine/phosphatidylglycerophosphate/cardiolipin synthase-like enzyme
VQSLLKATYGNKIKEKPMFKIIKSPWENVFLRLLAEAKTSVFLASPFIKSQTASLITQNVGHGVDFRYINSFKLAHFHTGASDLEALRILKKENCKQKNVHNLHAKLFIIDDVAIITSGNLTPGGLRNNLEYGILIRNKMVDEIKSDYLTIFNNYEYPEITIDIINKAEAILCSVPKEKRKTIKVTEKALFEEFINDENIEERFEGGTDSIVSNLSPWEKDVFKCLEKLKNGIFTLQEVYSHERRLSSLHPHNKNVQAKIRQQLQYLRDIGLIEFVRPGIYKKLWT